MQIEKRDCARIQSTYTQIDTDRDGEERERILNRLVCGACAFDINVCKCSWITNKLSELNRIQMSTDRRKGVRKRNRDVQTAGKQYEKMHNINLSRRSFTWLGKM